MKIDEYGEVLNAEETYQAIVAILQLGQNALIGWTDGEGSHFDILFSMHPIVFQDNQNSIQGGVRNTDLFVSIMRVGAFAFEINNLDTDWGYYNEKLGSMFSFGPVTGGKLAELINGVKKYLS